MPHDTDQNDALVHVRRAGIRDLSFVRKAVCEIHERRLESDEAMAAFLADETCYLYIAVAGDEVVGSLNGYALTHPHTRRPQFLLYEIDVRQSWRRRGIGSSLIAAFQEESRERGAFGLWVVTDRANTAAMGMYGKCGLATSDLEDVVFSMVP